MSVVVPTHNRRAVLGRTLQTILSQQVSDMEVVVVDDCSSDGTAEMVAAVRDSRVRLIRSEQPLGVARARNMGVDACHATWLAFCDDDDLWSSQKLGRQLSVLSSDRGAQWSAVGAVITDDQLRIRAVQRPPADEDVASLLLSRNAVPGGGSGVMARAALVREAGGFDENLSMFADWDLWIRLALASSLASVAQPLVVSVRHTHNMSLNVAGSLEELGYVTRKYATERADRGIDASDDMLLWIAVRDAHARRPLQALRLGLSVASNRRSLTPLKRVAFAALAPAPWRQRQHGARARNLSPDALREATALVEEVTAG